MENYANSDKVKLRKIKGGEGGKPYGVETIIVGADNGTHVEWFETVAEQEDEYWKVMGEISRGEWI